MERKNSGVQAKEATIVVTRQFYKNKRLVSEDENRKTIEILSFHDGVPVSSTSVKLGLTISLRQFESVRCDVMGTVPHYEEERDDAFLYMLGQVESELKAAFGDRDSANDLAEKARAAMKGKKK